MSAPAALRKSSIADGEGGRGDGDEPAIRHAEDPGGRIRRQRLGDDDAHDGEVEADLDVEADQDQEGGIGRSAPDGRVLREVEDQGVPDLVEPVHAEERQAGEDHVPVPALDLVRVDVEHQQQERDHVPLELAAVAQDRERSGARSRWAWCRLLVSRDEASPRVLIRTAGGWIRRRAARSPAHWRARRAARGSPRGPRP